MSSRGHHNGNSNSYLLESWWMIYGSLFWTVNSKLYLKLYCKNSTNNVVCVREMWGVVNQLIGVSLYRRPVASLMMKPVATSNVREGSETEEVPAVSVSSGLFFFFSCTLITWSFGVCPGWYSDCGLFPCKTNTGTSQDKKYLSTKNSLFVWAPCC